AGSFRVAVGRDCRLSGPRVSADLIRGLREAGADVIDVGVGPTPYLYFAAHHLGTDGSVMVTGSHNPADENGLKIMRGKASFFGDDIRRLGEMVEAQSFGVAASGGLEKKNFEDAYVAALTSKIRIEDPSIRVVVDAGNGAAGPLGLKAL